MWQHRRTGRYCQVQREKPSGEGPKWDNDVPKMRPIGCKACSETCVAIFYRSGVGNISACFANLTNTGDTPNQTLSSAEAIAEVAP